MSSYYSVRELNNYFDRRIDEEELIAYGDDLDSYEEHLKDDVDRIAKEATSQVIKDVAESLSKLDDDEILVLQRYDEIDLGNLVSLLLESFKVR